VRQPARVLALFLIATPVARAQSAPPPAPPAEAPPPAAPAAPARTAPELPYSLAADAAITGAAIAVWVGSEALKGHLAPESCRWCNPPGFDSSVRDALVWQNTGRADVISYVVPLVLEPAVVFGLNAYSARDQAPPRAGWVDALLVSEATAIAMAMNQTVKFIVGRERPFVHELDADEKPMTSRPTDNNLSFYSGHATLAFAMAASGGTIASMRGYRLAPWVWGIGMSLAAATAYLRIAADRHYASDVTVGAVVGGLTGFAVPYLFHNPHARSERRVFAAPVLLDHASAGLGVRGVFLDRHGCFF
jgi:membrane-associated phospholipid phosphatase